MSVIKRFSSRIRIAHSKLLISLYRRYNRQQSSRERAGFLVINEFYCKEIEDLAINIPKPKAPNNLITKYLSLRFSKRMRCVIKNINGREIGRMALDTPVDISRMVDFIDKNCRIPVSGENTQKTEKKSKAPEQKDLIPFKKTQEDSPANMSSKELKLRFTDEGKQEYLKEKEETSVVINRIASMNASKVDIPDKIEQFILAQFMETNGFTADIACVHSGLREQFNIIWAESAINKINAKYWDTLKSSLITVSEDGKYQIRKEQLDIIRHE